MKRLAMLSLAFAVAAVAGAQYPPAVLAARDNALDELLQVQPDAKFLYNGAAIERIYGAPLGGGLDHADAAMGFVSRYKDAFGIGQGQLRLTGFQKLGHGRFTAAYFDQTVAGLPVEQGYLTVLMREDLGLPIVLASSNVKHVRETLPAVQFNAKSAVRGYAMSRPFLTQFGTPSLVVWMGESDQHLAWKFTASGREYISKASECCSVGFRDAAFTVFVDATTGKMLHERSEICWIDVNGSVKGWGQAGLSPDWPANAETLQGLPNLQVAISGGASVFTDANGNYTIPNAGVTPVTVTSGLTGRWVNVVPAQGALLSSSNSVTPPGPNDIVYGAGLAQFDVAQINAYVHVNKVHDFVKAQNATYPGVDISLTCNVNQNSTCNANFNSGNMTINFFAQGGSCPNTSYASVVYHEYGHFVINRGGTAQGGYGEGMGDTIAALLGDDPRLGLEWSGQGTGPLRHAINSIHYPENSGSPIHTAGQMVSGAFWETVEKMNTTIGHVAGLAIMRNLAIDSILLHPPGISPALTVDVLTLDDNDANLNNGTPHYDDIAFGFGKKGLTAPPIVWLTFNTFGVLPDFMVHQGAFDPVIVVKLQIQDSAGQLDIESVKFHTKVDNGPWTNVPMFNYFDPGGMACYVDQPGSGSTVYWYIEAKDMEGHTMYYPSEGAAAPRSTLFAASLTTIFNDTFETANAWTITNTSLTSGAWVRADPIGTTNSGQQANPENDSNDAGAQCMFTGQGAVGGAAGAADVDGGPTDLTSPVFNLAGSDALIDYSRWYYSVNGVADSFLVQVSNNGGASWTTVETVTGVQNSWTDKTFRVSSFVAPTATVQVRFRATDNPNDSVTEAAIDAFRVRKINF